MTPTQRTLAELKKRGMVCGIVERWVPRQSGPTQDLLGGFRVDLFGIIDIIALGPDGVRGVQSCGNSYAAHWQTLTASKALWSALWLLTPGTRLEIWAWRKLKVKRGGKAMRWTPRITPVELSHLPDQAVAEARDLLANYCRPLAPEEKIA